MSPEFIPFPKMARLSRECLITEKIDGTNASIRIIKPEVAVSNFSAYVAETNGLLIWAGSRTRWITPEKDNHDFARWVRDNAEELSLLGPGHHFGEWWGSGIQRNYGLKEKRFSLFNAIRWCRHDEEPQIASVSWDHETQQMVEKMQNPAPACCHIVPVLYRGEFSTDRVSGELAHLSSLGSKAAPGFMKPEGVVCFHLAGNVGFKKTIEGDHEPKGKHP